MYEKLEVIKQGEIQTADERTLELAIDRIICESRNNLEEVSLLALESTSFLTSAKTHSQVLESQGFLKRIAGEITGKNNRLRNSILQDNTMAQYAAQTMMNRVMRECIANRELALVVNKRLDALYFELKENQIGLSEEILQVRQAVAVFYKKYTAEIEEQKERVSTLEEYERSYCPKCRFTLYQEQIICPRCGEVHPLKIQKRSETMKDDLKGISALLQKDFTDPEIIWDIEARKVAATLAKADALARRGNLVGYTDSVKMDIAGLIEKCRSAEFQIAIVGVMKAGKSMLMNALMGVEIASVGINPETAALTKFRSSSDFYVKVRFHNDEQWNRLCASAKRSTQTGKGSLVYYLNFPEVQENIKNWIGKKTITEKCSSVEELKETVKKWTSTQSYAHIFVSEVEVGIKRNIFNMPNEVVFVDTPGLQDPVQYRSDITKEYIKKSNAVLIAVPTAALTAEGLSTITTVFDYIGFGKDKAYIVATQKDKLNSSEDLNEVLNGWITHLVSTKRFDTPKSAGRRIISTSAYMQLCLQKIVSLTEEELNDPEKMSDEEYNNLENYVKKELKKRRFSLDSLRDNENDLRMVEETIGIQNLKNRLERELISQYRKLKMKDIRDEYLCCRKELLRLSKNASGSSKTILESARGGAETLKRRLEESDQKYNVTKRKYEEIANEAEKLRRTTRKIISELQ